MALMGQAFRQYWHDASQLRCNRHRFGKIAVGAAAMSESLTGIIERTLTIRPLA
jgi:hypothetical protein